MDCEVNNLHSGRKVLSTPKAAKFSVYVIQMEVGDLF